MGPQAAVAVAFATLLLLLLIAVTRRMSSKQTCGRFAVSWLPPPNRKSALAIDLDETLVHTSASGTLVRPGTDTFLRAVSGMFDDLVIFTAGTASYANPIIDCLEASSGVRIAHRLFRDSCTPVLDSSTGHLVGYTKDLGKVSAMTGCGNVLLLDNTPLAYSMQPASGIPIPSFFDDLSDNALADVLPILRARALVLHKNEQLSEGEPVKHHA